jgi:integrase
VDGRCLADALGGQHRRAGVRPNTISGYRVAVHKHLVPGLGAHRLDRLQPEHVERLYAKMIAGGSAPATAHQAHRTLRTALNEAVRRGHLTKNPATVAKAPRVEEREVEPYSVREVQRLLDVAGRRRNSARWAIALALGLRQSEALGLRWSDVDLVTGTLVVRRGRQRPKWRHGCAKPCGRKYGGHCPERVPLREVTTETKSRAGRRGMGLPDELLALLRRHEQEQIAERAHAAQLWTEGGWLFTTPLGEPVNPRTDYDEWKRLLQLAGLRDGRLHDARHTAATVLLLLGVPERTVMSVMGWSSTSMAARYQHVTAEIHRDVAARVGGLIWQPGDRASGEVQPSPADPN